MKYFYFFILFFSFLEPQAASHIRIKGKVLNKKSESPVANAILKFNKETVVITDESGNFSISLEKGNCNYCVEKFGYCTLEKKLNLKNGAQKLIIYLEKDSDFLEEVILEGYATKASSDFGKVKKIKTEFLVKSLNNGIIESLSKQAGIQKINTGTNITKASIRGFHGSRISVFTQGAKQEGQQWGTDHGLELDQFNFEEVEIIKGASTLKYGSDALGGVINFLPSVVVKENTNETKVFFNYKSNNESFGLSAQHKLNVNNKFLNVKASHTDFGNYKVPATSFSYLDHKIKISDNVLVNTSGSESQLSFTAGLIKRDFELRLTASTYNLVAGMFPGAHGTFNNRTLEKYSIDNRNPEFPRQEVQHHKFSINGNNSFTKSKLSYNITYQQNVRNEKSNAHRHYNRDVDVNSNLEHGLKLHTLSSRLDFDLEKDKWDNFTGLNAQYQKNEREGFAFLIPEFTSFSTGAYHYVNFKPNTNILLTAGARVDFKNFQKGYFLDTLNLHPSTEDFWVRSQNKERNFFDYALNLGFNYKPAHSIWESSLSIAKTYRFPDQAELSMDGIHHGAFRHERGDFDIPTEKGYQFDLNLELKPNSHQLSFNPYFYFFENYIYLNPSGEFSKLPAGEQVYQYESNKATIYGFEISYNKTFFRKIALDANAEYSHRTNLDTGLPLPFSPPLSTLIALEYKFLQNKKNKLSDVYFGAEHNWTSSQRRVNRNETPTDAYQLVNLSAGFSFRIRKVKADFRTSVHNLFDIIYQNHLSNYKVIGLPEQGRNFNFSLILNL